MTVETPLNEAQEKLANIDPDMPVFPLLGQDELAEATVMFWIRKAIEKGVSQEKIDGAKVILADIQRYQPKKLPD